MKVSELIAKLQGMPQELEVYRFDCEFGPEVVTEVEVQGDLGSKQTCANPYCGHLEDSHYHILSISATEPITRTVATHCLVAGCICKQFSLLEVKGVVLT